MPPLTIPQVMGLGASIVAASFGLNWFLLRGMFTDLRRRMDRIEKSLTAENGLLVRVAVLEDRRDGSPGRRATDNNPSLAI